MLSDKYIRCRNCNDVHHVTPFDRAPVYGRVAGEGTEACTDDRRAFLQRHANHKLEALQATGESSFCGDPSDPMTERYVAVTNGHEDFVLRGFRTRVDQALRFDLTRGRCEIVGAFMEAQATEIRKELLNHFPWPAEKPSEEKIDLFTALFGERVRSLKPEDLRLSGAAIGPEEYGCLEAGTIEKLLADCAPHFTAAEMNALREFVDEHRDADGVLAVRVHYRYRLRSS